jgi:uncharacterized protein YraI
MRKLAFGLMTILTAVCLAAGGTLAQSGVQALVVNEFANIRFVPALGAEVLATLPSGYAFNPTGRSPDNEWLRIEFNGDEGWVNVATLVILSGDTNSLPVADPRTIPYGGFETPRAGLTSATSSTTAKLTSGLHLRAGPGTGYPTLANPPINSLVPLLGRTASSSWVQINFEGTLGWVTSRYLELQDGANLGVLPIDGIVAESLPISQATRDNYIATLKLMLARIDLAQPSLDAIRAAWTDAALAGRTFCHAYPPRPSDYNIPNPLLAAFYPILNPLIISFNDAMFNIRHAIDLFIQACNQPGTGNPVGTAMVQGALGVVNLADGQFVELRRRLSELIPPDRVAGPNECLLTFNGEVDILPVIASNTVYTSQLDSKTRALGACFDAVAGQTYLFEAVQTETSNAVLFLAVSPLDNPTNFIAVGLGAGSPLLPVIVGPALISTSGRYLFIISDAGGDRDAPLKSTLAYAVVNSTGLSVPPQLMVDPTTGQFVLGAGASTGTVPGVATATPGPGTTAVCPSLAFTCNQLFTCSEARACLAAGNFSLDPDGNGVPCEQNLLCPGP